MSDTPQTPDPRPGNYYVSAIDGPRTALLLGPFPTHQQALDEVDTGRDMACDLDPRAHFYAFGTCRMPDDYTKPGVLTRRLQEVK